MTRISMPVPPMAEPALSEPSELRDPQHCKDSGGTRTEGKATTLRLKLSSLHTTVPRWSFRRAFELVVSPSVEAGVCSSVGTSLERHDRLRGVWRANAATVPIVLLARAAFTAMEHQAEGRSSESARADCGMHRRAERGERGKRPYKQKVDHP
jgi:hypothetical protein